MIARTPLDLLLDDVFIKLDGFIPSGSVFVKVEGFNPAGSIKLKPAIHMLEELEAQGIVRLGSRIIESSSGNLGVALSLVCATKGYPFTCVSDPNISPQNRRLIEVYGGQVVIVDRRDANGGFLNSRIDLIKEWVAKDPDFVWVNQYANMANKGAHRRRTGPEILRQFPRVDYLFIGAGTTGTLMGCAEFFRSDSPHTRIIAVDSVGSVTFDKPPGKRHIPGLGTSRRPEIVNPEIVDDIVMVAEKDTLTMCHHLLKEYSWLMGGSTGTTLAGVLRYAYRLRPGQTVVAISPDLGERYIDTIYNDSWVQERFPGLPLETSAASRVEGLHDGAEKRGMESAA